MKEADFRKILNHIFSKFRCPNCQESLEDGDIKILAKSSQGFFIEIDCPSCGVELKINAIDNKNKSSKKILKEKNIKNTIEKIKKFKGNNIADLFK